MIITTLLVCLTTHFCLSRDNKTDIFTTTLSTETDDNVTLSEIYNYTVTEATPSCEKNESCSQNVTTYKIENATSKSEKRNILTEHFDADKEICTCNLLADYCDINCCCDIDCSYNQKLIFDQCDTIKAPEYDTRFCDYLHYAYINYTHQEIQFHRNDLFCVVKSNLPPSYIVQRKQPLKNLEEALHFKENKFSWMKRVEKLNFQPGNTYERGQPVWVIMGNRTVQQFSVLQAFITSGCNAINEVKFLHDVESRCFHNNISKQNIYLDVTFYIKNITFLSDPSLLNGSSYLHLGDKWICPKNVCLEIDARKCNEDFSYCQDFSKNMENEKMECNDYRCRNVVKQIRYVIFHNGTKGLTKIEIFVHLFDYNSIPGDMPLMEQKINVEFRWFNYTLNYSKQRSGNPGYIIGKPILIGRFINNTIIRDKANFAENFMVLPNNIQGKCYIGHNFSLPTAFGYNILTKCKIQNNISIAKLNATEVCRKVQLMIFLYWNYQISSNGTLSNISYGYFGNANSSNLDEWGTLFHKIYPEDILKNIYGNITKDKTKVICQNLTTTMSTDIYHSRIDLGKLVQQEKILAVTNEFEDFHQEEFILGHKAILILDLPLLSQVFFYDITDTKVRKLVDPPSLEIKLPYDFFYPFVKLYNNGNLSRVSINMVCFLLFFSLKGPIRYLF